MKNIILIGLLYFFIMPLSEAQPKLTYYLPDISYNEAITTPEEFLKWQVGEWHVSHDLLSFYMAQLATETDRISIETYAYSHEKRPLQLLTITSPENQKRIHEIQQSHIDISDGKDVDFENLPAVIYQGYSIHGNESSGSNASLLVAYYLAAGESEHVHDLLDNLVVLLDPCYNPDGLSRFSSWVNSNRYTNLIFDNQSREFNEPWPRGRTNHYLFDLNRDWLLLTHPESRGRIKNFHKWKPNVLTDHHEMGTNRTFFFQPGIPTRTNPNTPEQNQVLTERIGNFHAKALDEIGSLYYSKESFDDFYYGKGSTYPDAHGCIGILFEQASSRGHLQESINGVLSFPFTIRNQVKTSLSTQNAALRLRTDLLEFKSKFYKDIKAKAKANPVKGYVFSDHEQNKLHRFMDKLIQHDIKVYPLEKSMDINQQHYPAAQSYVVPLEQRQYTLAKTLFESVTTFEDSLFYDVSAWTMPLAFNVRYDALDAKQLRSADLGAQVKDIRAYAMKTIGEAAKYAYIIPWDQTEAPAALYKTLAEGLKTRIVTKPFELNGSKICAGSIILPIHNQSLDAGEIFEFVKNVQKEHKLNILSSSTGQLGDITLGSPGQRSIELPRIALIAGSGSNSYDVGEIWQHLDVELEIPFTMLDVHQFSRANLDKYNVIFMADGSYSSNYVNSDKLKTWLKDGGTLIVFKSAIDQLASNKIIKVDKQGSNFKASEVHEYSSLGNAQGAQRIGGSIFNTKLKMDHPLAYGYQDEELAVLKRGTRAYNFKANPLAVVSRYTEDPLLSGYCSDENIDNIKNSAAVFAYRSGNGKIICFVDDILFRGYWFGGHKLFANALFYHSLINSASMVSGE